MDNKEIGRIISKYSNGVSKKEREELVNTLINQLINISLLNVEEEYDIDIETYKEYMYDKILEENDDEDDDYSNYCYEIEQENKRVGIFVGNEEYIQTPMDAGEFLADKYLEDVQDSESRERKKIKKNVFNMIQNHVKSFLDDEYGLEEIQLVQNS